MRYRTMVLTPLAISKFSNSNAQTRKGPQLNRGRCLLLKTRDRFPTIYPTTNPTHNKQQQTQKA
jgi:hypothetical protein